MGYIAYFQVAKSKEIIRSPYNPRLDSMAERVVRGKILDHNGEVLATSEVLDDGSEVRYYPYENMFAHVIGYSAHGKSGMESSGNFELLTSNAFFLEKIIKEFKGEKNIGDNVVTTLDVGLQQAAYNALGDRKGAVVITEPSTGKILAMVSKPDFNPNSVEENWDSLNQNTESVLLNRATQGQYAPGSAFKLVTALEFMREDPNYQNYSYECTGSITIGDTTIPCAGHAVHGQVGLGESLAYSCNSSFCNIGSNLDVSSYQKTAKQLLFNSKLPGGMPYSKSKFKLSNDDPMSEKMMTAMGQGRTQVSPYHMALITSAIANQGVLMKPYLVDQITNYTGTIVKSYKPEEYQTLMTPEEASQLKSYMTEVTSYGTASVMNGAGYTVAGKTGTAEYSDESSDKNHSWFVGFTNVDNPELAISVIIEEADGNAKAVNVAKQIFDQYYY